MFQRFEILSTWLAAHRRDEEGATAVEYGMIVALIAAVIVLIVGFLGTDVKNAFDTVEKAQRSLVGGLVVAVAMLVVELQHVDHRPPDPRYERVEQLRQYGVVGGHHHGPVERQVGLDVPVVR